MTTEEIERAITGFSTHLRIITEIVKDLMQTPESVQLPDGGQAFRESAFNAQYRFHVERLYPPKAAPASELESRIGAIEEQLCHLISILTAPEPEAKSFFSVELIGRANTDLPNDEDPELDALAQKMADEA